ncbi:MAG: OmpA family protein [Sandaracinaceae bacterium]|nr:OmpA family protein [Myxococcales bacterium]MCB9660690.1 OmpA family protein [Sandaracinaceae bacterium]
MYLPEDTLDGEDELPNIWAAFGDLMACLFGLFVLFFVWLVTVQVALSEDLEAERATREAATARLEALESVLAGPLSSGMITLVDGRIGIRGNLLFALGSVELRPEGRALLRSLVPPLQTYLGQNELSLMVSGFTDDTTLRPNGSFADNWEVSAQRSLTVTRELVEAGMPADWIFAAGFGANHPVAPNDTEEHRAMNRRVEISPVPRLIHRFGNATEAPGASDLAGPVPLEVVDAPAPPPTAERDDAASDTDVATRDPAATVEPSTP